MMYDIDCPADLGAAIDTEQRKLVKAIARRDAAMVVIQIARQTSNWLTTDQYIAFKIIHGNAEADVERARVYLQAYGLQYYGVKQHEWLEAQENIATRITGAGVWQAWRDVLASWKRVKQVGHSMIFSNEGDDLPLSGASIRSRIDAMIAMEAAEDLYQTISREHDGRVPLSWDQRRRGQRLVRPKHADPRRRRRTVLVDGVRTKIVKEYS